jgi:hypothetical protein
MAEVLDLCFSETADDSSSQLFLIFARMSPAILGIVCKDDKFMAKFSSILADSSPSRCVMSRISSLLGRVLANFPEKAQDCSGFIFRMMEFIDEPGIVSLIYKIIEPRSRICQAQTVLAQAGFAELVIHDLKRTDLNEMRLVALFRVIRESSTNQILRPSFQTEEMLKMLTIYTQNKSSLAILNELWRAIYEVTCSDNQATASDLVKSAISIVGDYYTVIHMYQIFALDFLAKMMQLKSEGLLTFYRQSAHRWR